MLGFFNNMISVIVTILFSYQIVYIFVSLFIQEKEKEYEHRYNNFAVLICARNEELVISDLLTSIKQQSYPKDRYATFVLADNCSDHTAEVAQKHGAIVYERYNNNLIGKGYALSELLNNIERDYGDVFDGFLVFDADNILDKNYLEQMNISYCKGNHIIAGYINSKNYSSNWISAGYSLFLLKKNRFLNNARHLLGLSCAINGTGFLFDKRIVENWTYHTLTEDIEFSVDQTCRHNRISYCSKAILYDEQPTSFKQSFYQRLRWAKGYLQVIRKYSLKLIKGIGERDFSCYDMLNTIISAYSLSTVSVFANIAIFIFSIISDTDIIPLLISVLYGLIKAYIGMYLLGLLTTITEWKMIKANKHDKIIFTFTFPIFIATYIPIAIYALFAKVKWVPIKHSITMKQEGVI